MSDVLWLMTTYEGYLHELGVEIDERIRIQGETIDQQSLEIASWKKILNLQVSNVTRDTAITTWNSLPGAEYALTGRSGTDNRGNGPTNPPFQDTSGSRTWVWLLPATTYTITVTIHPYGVVDSVTFTTLP